MRIHAFGGPVSVDEVPEPFAADDELVVDVTLAAVNPLDLWVAEGSVAGGTQPLPFVLGTEAVGTYNDQRVIVSGFGLGSIRDGLYRDRAAVPKAAVSPVPDGVDDDQAAAATVAGVTAKRIVDVAQISKGDVVAVFGASGGVGVVVLQVAKLAGASVIGVTSSQEKAEALRELGADEVIVGTTDELPSIFERRSGAAVDVVLNPLGGTSVDAAAEILRLWGKIVLFGRSESDRVEFSAGRLYRKNITLIGYGGLNDPPDTRAAALAWVLEQIADGRLRIPITRELPLGDAGPALDLIRTKGAVGKVLLRVRD